MFNDLDGLFNTLRPEEIENRFAVGILICSFIDGFVVLYKFNWNFIPQGPFER